MNTDNVATLLGQGGLNKEDVDFAQEFLKTYYQHGKLVVDAANKVRASLELNEIGMPERKMADLTSMIIDFEIKKNSIGNSVASARVDPDRFASAVNGSGQKLVVAAFPFGISEVTMQEYAAQEEATERQMYKAIEDPNTHEFLYYRAQDNFGHEVLAGLRVNSEGGQEAYAYTLDESGEQIPQELILETKYREIMRQPVEIKDPYMSINEPYSSEKAQDSFTDFYKAVSGSQAFVIAAGGNINSFG